MNDIKTRVAAGVALLSKERSGWQSLVNLDLLDMEDHGLCIIGQVFGIDDLDDSEMFSAWGEAVRELIDTDDPATYGFDLTQEEYDLHSGEALYDKWDALHAAWLKEVLCLRGLDENGAPLHVDYPHESGTLYGCGPCEDIMHELEASEAGEL